MRLGMPELIVILVILLGFGSMVAVVPTFWSRYASDCTICAYTPRDTLFTNTRPPTVARSMVRSYPSVNASSEPTTSSRSTPRSRARWLRVPAGMHTNGTPCSPAMPATSACEPSPPAIPTASTPDATAWHVRISPETQLRAIFAGGQQAQRITGQGLGNARLVQSQVFGEPCGRYWLEGGAGPALAELTQEVFGRPHDAVYQMRIGSVVIGGTDPDLDQPVGRGD